MGTVPDAIVAGDFTGDGRLDLAVVKRFGDDVSVLLGNGDGTFQPAGHYAVGSSNPRPSWRATSTATAGSTSAVANSSSNDVSVLLGNGDGTFQPQVTYAVGAIPDVSIVAGDFTGDGHLDLAVANDVLRRRVRCCWATATGPSNPSRTSNAVGANPIAIVAGDFTGDGQPRPGRRQLTIPTTSRCCWATATAPSSPQVTYAVGIASQTPSWRVTSTATAGSTWPSPMTDDDVSMLLGNGDGTFQPQERTRSGRVICRRHRGGRLQRRRPPRPGRRSFNNSVTDNWATSRCSWATATARSSPQSTQWRRRLPPAIVAGDFNGDGQLDLAVADQCYDSVTQAVSATSACSWATATARSSRQVTYAVGLDPQAIVAGDFTGDGRLDLAVAG